MGEARRRKAEIEKLKARVGNWYGEGHFRLRSWVMTDNL